MRSVDNNLLKKYFNDSCTDAEKALVRRFLSSPKGNEALKEFLEEQHEEDYRDFLQEETISAHDLARWRKKIPIPNKSEYSSSVYRMSWGVLAKAAIFILISGIASYIYFTFQSQDKAAEASLLVEAINLKGQQRTIVLADSTTVFLGPDSKLKYPKVFSSENRTVYVEGEAFFEVSTDAKRPFVVTSRDSLTITVLGTSFNVKSYQNDRTARVSVATGKVKIASSAEGTRPVLLEPGEEGVWQKIDRHLSKRKINLESIALWRSNRLSFDDTPFSEVITSLERKYNVRITVKRKKLLEESTTLTIGNEPLEQVLIPLGFSHDFKYYSANDSTIIIQ